MDAETWLLAAGDEVLKKETKSGMDDRNSGTALGAEKLAQ